VSVPWQPAPDARGLLLVSGLPGPASGWVRRGLVACHVVPLGSWTALVPAEPTSRAEPPYDDAVGVLAGRPVPRRMRPALGFFVVAGRAVVTLQAKRWRTGTRWLVWEPGVGVARLPDLEPARPAQLATAAGAPAAVRDVAREVARAVADRSGDADRVLADLLRALRLPGRELLRPDSRSDGGHVVAPTAQAVERFDRRMSEQARHRAELEESS
jgi:hypothetical protein